MFINTNNMNGKRTNPITTKCEQRTVLFQYVNKDKVEIEMIAYSKSGLRYSVGLTKEEVIGLANKLGLTVS